MADTEIDKILQPMREDEPLLKLRLRNVGWEIYSKGGCAAMQEAHE